MPPRFRTCPLCQEGFGTASLPIHVPQCYDKAIKRWRLNPVGPMPVMPSLDSSSRQNKGNKTIQLACGTGMTGARSLRGQAEEVHVPEYNERNENLHPCSRCGRKFLFDRIAYHESVCHGNRKRSVFDSSKQRAISDENGGVVGFGKSYGKGKKDTSKKPAFILGVTGGFPRTNWRERHREFVEAMRAARGAKKLSQAMWGEPVAKGTTSDRRGDVARAPPAVVRHQKGINLYQQRTRVVETPDTKLPIAGRRALPRRSYGSAFGGGGERFTGTGGMGTAAGGKIINDNTTSLGMLQAFGRA